MNTEFEIFETYQGELLKLTDVLKRITKLAYCVTDSKGCFIEVNQLYLDLYGYTEAELIGNHFSMVVPEAGKAFATQMHNDFIAGVDEMPATWTVQNKAGELIQIQAEAIRCQKENEPPSKLTLIERIG